MSAVPSATLIYLPQAEQIGEEMVKVLGCDFPTNERVMECLRSLPAEELTLMRTSRLQFFGAHWSEGVYFVNDGVNFKTTSNVFYSGKYDLDIPLIIGNTADEGTLFSMMSFPFRSQPETTYMQLVMSFSRHYIRSGSIELLPTLLKNYSVLNPKFNATKDPVHWAYSELISDGYFICPTQRLIKALSKRQPIYGFVFNYTNMPDGPLRAHHAADLMFSFGGDSTSRFGVPTHTESEREFSNKIVKYFSAFVKAGKPEVAGLATWPIYGTNGTLLSLDPEFKVLTNYKSEICPFWEQNFPTGYSYEGEDYLIHEPFLSKLFNKYPFVALLFLWRKRRFAKPVLGLLSIVTVLFWYKVITKCCCRNKNTKKSNQSDTKSDFKGSGAKQKTQ
jgi:para-nitrobenzyl esterase